MKWTSKEIIRSVAAYALLCLAASFSQAATILKLNLGDVGPDVGMNPARILSTIDQTGGPSPTGDQFTNIEYTGFLNFIPDLGTNTATYSMNGLNEVGPANVFGTTVVQNFNGGIFSLYDPADNLLLQGPLGNSALTGVIGPSSGGTGALFTTTFSNGPLGGSLAPLIVQGTVSLSMNMTNVNGGNGFAVAGGGPQLSQFLADATLSIAAEPVPEPTSLVLLGVGAIVAIVNGRGRRR